MGWDTVEKQTIHYISCDAAKKKKKNGGTQRNA